MKIKYVWIGFFISAFVILGVYILSEYIERSASVNIGVLLGFLLGLFVIPFVISLDTLLDFYIKKNKSDKENK